MLTTEERDSYEQILRNNLRDKSAELKQLWESVNDHWGYEDAIYRFYHQSFKVYRIQAATVKIVDMLQSLVPDRELNPWFQTIIQQGTDKQFSTAVNTHWLESTRPILEAFQHARYFLEMACRYPQPPEGSICPSGWAALLKLYGLW